MKTQKKQYTRHGIATIAAMIFIVVFAVISIGFLKLQFGRIHKSPTNHRAGNNAITPRCPAQTSRYLLVKAYNTYKTTSAYTSSKTPANTLSTTEANTLWNNIYTQLCTQMTTASNLGEHQPP